MLGAFLKVTSWRNPFLGLVIFWLFAGVVGIIEALTETKDVRLQTLLLGILIAIGVLALDMLSNAIFRLRRASRYCQDCINKAEMSRRQRPEERGPHKIALQKKQ